MITDKIEESMFLFLDTLFASGSEANVILFSVLPLTDEEALVSTSCIAGGDKVGIILFTFPGTNLVAVRDGTSASTSEKPEESLTSSGLSLEGSAEKPSSGGSSLTRT